MSSHLPNSSSNPEPHPYFRERSKEKWAREEFESLYPNDDFLKAYRYLVDYRNGRLQKKAKIILQKQKKVRSSSLEAIPLLGNGSITNSIININCSNLSFGNSGATATTVPPTTTPLRNHNQEEEDSDHTLDTEALLKVKISLPSGKTLLSLLPLFDKSARDEFLTHRILHLGNPSVQEAFEENDLNHLNRIIPALPQVPPYFKAVVKSCIHLIEEPQKWPIPPEPKQPEDKDIRHYVVTAFSHFTRYMPVLQRRGPLHGEGWADANVWTPLVDFAYLGSGLSIDRKGMALNPFKHDGIVRSMDVETTDVGFIDVKPRLIHKNSNYGDKKKLLISMVSMLCKHRNPELVVQSILCSGMTITVIRGILVPGESSASDVFLFKEFSDYVTLDRLAGVVELVWRTKLGFEKTYQALAPTGIPEHF